MEQIEQSYHEDFDAYSFVLDNHNWDKIPQDSIDKVIFYRFRFDIFYYTSSNLWNVFQNSGMVQKLQNAELVSRISESYYWIEFLNTIRQEYLKRKEILTNVYEVEFDKQPYKYLQALINNRESRKFLEETVRFNVYDFSDLNNQLTPIIDFALYSIDNYDNPKKLAIDFETFSEMQKKIKK
jgi:hypothetical protein